MRRPASDADVHEPVKQRRPRLRVIAPVLATVLVLAPLGYLWQDSRVPNTLSVMDMGEVDHGGGPGGGHDHHPTGGGPGGAGATVSIDTLRVDPARPADVRYELTTAAAPLSIGGTSVPGFTVNGTSPGPTLTAEQGQLVEVHLVNASVTDGVALHWHGIDVPNAMDGVAGVTQDAVPVGGDFTYRFTVDRPGTYWYHSHQVSNPQVIGGLFGALVVAPATAQEPVQVLATAHLYGGRKTLAGQPGDLRAAAAPGQRVRVRVLNTDNGLIQTWSASPLTVLAVDGNEINAPTPFTDRAVTVTGGGRVDLGVTMPADGSPVRIQVSKATAVILGSGDPPAPTQPGETLALEAYGTATALPFDPSRPDRRFDYAIDQRPGFVKGRPGLWWSINGKLYPHVPMFAVTEGDVVTMHLDNRSGEVHPMHLHGHRGVVLSRNGKAVTGSPWWFDTLDVADRETYDIAFVADNPGIWMDHCHNLEHAADGMVAHLMYRGFDTPYRIGGPAGNQPE